MTPDEFFADALPWARQVHAQMPEMFVSVVLAQWAEETGYGGPDWIPNNNPGNVGSFDNQPVAKFPTMQTGVNAYKQTMQLHYYDAVRAATTWQSQAYALGQSPWASAHYMAAGPPPGEDLIKIVNLHNLTQYDAPIPPPNPPTQQENDTVTSLISGGQLHVWGIINNVAYHWYQPLGGFPSGPTWKVETLPL
jgi:hypothetical protein